MEYNQVLSNSVIQALSACNELNSPLRDGPYDQKFVRLMVIAMYTTEELSTKTFPPEKRDMMEKIFGVRTAGCGERKNKFNSVFTQALKECIARNSKNAEKLTKIHLPEDILERKKR